MLTSTTRAAAAALAVSCTASAFALQDPAWTRPIDGAQATADGTTYQRWEFFSVPYFPETPDPSDIFSLSNPPDITNINPNGSADFYDSAATEDPFDSDSGSFITSGGNIYSFSDVIKPEAVVPTVEAVTEFHVQVSTFGGIPNTGGVSVNGVDISTLPNYSYVETARTLDTFPPFGSALRIDHLWTFTAPSASLHTIDWSWDVTSTSVDRVFIDTLAVPGLEGDYDADGDVDADDIDLLLAEINGAADPSFDLTGDGVTDSADLTELIETILATAPGDANLDGEVGTGDLAVLAGNFNTPGSGWASGDFDGSGDVGTGDLAILAGTFGFVSSPAVTTAVIPEPASLGLLSAGLLGLAARRRRGV